MPNPTTADNGVESMAQIMTEMGEDPSVLELPPSEGLDPLPTEGEPPQRDDKGRFTKTPEPKEELPGILKDAERQEDDLPTDEEIDDLIKGLPQTEAENARKGVSKLVNRAKAYEAQFKEKEEAFQRYQSWEAALSDPSTAEDALARLTAQVQQIVGKPQVQAQPNQAKPVNAPPDPNNYVDGEGNCNWAQWAADMAAHAKAEATAAIRAEMAKEIEPVKGFVSQAQAERQAIAKAEAAVPSLQAMYGKDLASPERVRQAVQKHPSLPVEDAFAATHVREIAKHFASAGKNLTRAPKREMLGSEAIASRERSQPPPGGFHSMDSILEEISIE